MKSHPVQTIANAFGCGLFSLFAALQLNDIDPAVYYHPSELDAALWCAFYLVVAVLFGIAIFRPVSKWLLAVGAAFCLVEMVRTAPGLYENLFGEEDFTMTQVSMSAKDPRVELSREFFGAFIALGGVAFLFFQQLKRKRPA